MPNDVADDWEFKILRSTSAAFRKRETFEQALREEAEAGWVLLEKLDDSRLRLKRPRATRQQAAPTARDPYRSNYGMTPQATALLVALITIAFLFAILLAVLLLK